MRVAVCQRALALVVRANYCFQTTSTTERQQAQHIKQTDIHNLKKLRTEFVEKPACAGIFSNNIHNRKTTKIR